MPVHTRVLDSEPIASLDAYRAAGGGAALEEARAASASLIVDEIDASGLRGRGGAGFPTGRKWRTVAGNCTPELAATVVVNGAEGEPGSFKDRAIMRANPYRVLEGALVAAHGVGADSVVFALKRTFATELARMRAAVDEARAAGWLGELEVVVFAGPSEYLYGEETALLEAIDGRYPFPRVAPPYRRGVDEVVDAADDVDDESSSAAHVRLAGPSGESAAPPTLVDNVETLANVPGIIVEGAEWFRSVGTPGSAGTIVCTVTGRSPRHGVAEFPMGTPLREVLETIGGVDLAAVQAVMTGVSNPLLRPEDLEVPLGYEELQAIGSGLGTAGFIVYDHGADLAAVAAGVARFLAVESCGQCSPCKLDGRTISERLAVIVGPHGHADDLTAVRRALETVGDSARCNLASQQQVVVGSILDRFPGSVTAHVEHHVKAVPVEPVTAIVDIVDGRAQLDDHELAKQPDWTFDPIDSGQAPADRLADHHAPHENL